MGSSININVLPLNMLEVIGIPQSRIQRHFATVIHGVGKMIQQTLGTVQLRIQVGVLDDIHVFDVLDSIPSYHLLLGRPWLHKYEAIPSSFHQCVKFWRGKQPFGSH